MTVVNTCRRPQIASGNLRPSESRSQRLPYRNKRLFHGYVDRYFILYVDNIPLFGLLGQFKSRRHFAENDGLLFAKARGLGRNVLLCAKARLPEQGCGVNHDVDDMSYSIHCPRNALVSYSLLRLIVVSKREMERFTWKPNAGRFVEQRFCYCSVELSRPELLRPGRIAMILLQMLLSYLAN